MKHILIVGAITVAFLTSCGKKETSDKKAKLEQLKKEYSALAEEITKLDAEVNANVTKPAIDVLISPIIAESFKTYLEVQGKVDARQNIDLSAKMPGVITSIFVKEGSSVRKGQVLAEIDNAQLVKGIQELKLQMQFVNNLYDKQKTLWDQKIGTELQYLQAKNNKEGLEKRMESSLEQLDMTKIKSPINGTVDEVMVKLGQMAAPGYPTFRVVNFNDMRVIAEVAESYAGKVDIGDKAIVSFPDINTTIDSKVDFVSKSINGLNRTFKAEVSLGNLGPKLHPNMIATIKINDYEETNVIVLPINLIQKTENGSFVMVSENEKAVRKEVTLGKSYAGKTVVISGLKVGDSIITTGYQDLPEGALLKISK